MKPPELFANALAFKKAVAQGAQMHPERVTNIWHHSVISSQTDPVAYQLVNLFAGSMNSRMFSIEG